MWPGGGVDQQQICIVVIVQVEQRRTASHGLWQELLPGRSIEMHEVDTGLGGDVREAHSGNPGWLYDRFRRLALDRRLRRRLRLVTGQKNCQTHHETYREERHKGPAQGRTDHPVVSRHLGFAVG